MKKYFFLPVAALLFLTACGNNSYIAETWENGKPKIVLRVDKGTREKPVETYYKAYYPNGKIFKEGLITDTVEEGIWKTYYASGELRSEGTYHAGVKTGEFSIYYRDGIMEQTGEYNKDSVVTASLYYHSGKMMEVDSTTLILGTGKPKWTDIQYALMHMECNMIFFDNYDRGTKVCSCFIDLVQSKLTYDQYQLLTERQVSILMKYLMPEYKPCIDA